MVLMELLIEVVAEVVHLIEMEDTLQQEVQVAVV
jgi:hypothetical protein